MSIKIYLAGDFFCEDRENWRLSIVRNLGDISERNPEGYIQNAIFNNFDFVGPYDQRLYNDFSRSMQTMIQKADIVFAWADDLNYEDTAKISAEIMYAKSVGKMVGVGSTSVSNEDFNSIWIPYEISSFYPFWYEGNTPKQSLKSCIRSLLPFVQMEEQIKLWKNPSSREFFEHNMDKAGYVYVIRAETGHYKIGRTTSIPRRMNLFSVKLPFKFDIINYFPCHNMFEIESHFHEVYSEKRTNGEWFLLSDEDVDIIKFISHCNIYEIIGKNDQPLSLNGIPWWSEEALQLISR